MLFIEHLECIPYIACLILPILIFVNDFNSKLLETFCYDGGQIQCMAPFVSLCPYHVNI